VADCLPVDGVAALSHDSFGDVCGAGLAAGLRRNLRSNFLFGEPARARDWYSHSAWRQQTEYFSARSWARPSAGPRWSPYRRCRRISPHSTAVELFAFAVRGRNQRSRYICLCIAPIGWRSYLGVLFAGPPRDESRSHVRLAPRIEPRTGGECKILSQ